MSYSLKIMLACIVALVVISNSTAHQLSPCYRVLTYEDGEPGQEPIRFNGYFCALVMTSQERSAVHEHMTAATIRSYRNRPTDQLAGMDWKWQYMVEKPWEKNGREHRSFPIIFGTWWNDDPLMLALGQSADFMRGGAKIWTAFRPNHEEYAGARGRCRVKASIHLGRASHLGDLQHLHFMTTEQIFDPAQRIARLQTTTSKALDWMSFAYRVATGELPAAHPLTAEMEGALGLPSIAENHCEPQADIKLRTLFARNGQSIAERDRRTPDVALGSMLHILQDSFAPAHTCRVVRNFAGQQVALLRDVENYSLQNKREHAALDQYPEWLLEFLQSGKHQYANDPIQTGAWLIDAVDRRLPWSDVEKYLRDTVFAFAPDREGLQDEKCIERLDSLVLPGITAPDTGTPPPGT